MVNTFSPQIDRVIDPRNSADELAHVLSTPMGDTRTIKCQTEFSVKDMLACLRGGVISAVFSCVLILYVAQSFMFNLLHPAAKSGLLWSALPGCTVACAVAGIALLFIYSLECRKSLTIDPFGLIINARFHEGIDTRLLVPWNWLDRITVRKPMIPWLGATEFEMRTKYGTAYTLKWDEVMTSTVTETLLAAVKTLAPHAVVDFGDIEKERTLRQDSFTQLWLQSLSNGMKRERRGRLADATSLCEDRYKVVACLGSGGQGTAYQAIDNSTGLEVVLKEYILPIHGGAEAIAGSRLNIDREIMLLSILDHRQIVRLIDHFAEDHRGYVVLEFVHGVSLRKHVQDVGKMTEKDVIAAAIAVCEILEYLHGQQPPVVHRDITPDNLIVEENKKIKLVDFNVARQFSCDKTAAVVGKQAFIPPEQFRGKATPQSDVYALGCTMFCLLTGLDPEPMCPSHPIHFQSEISSELDRIVAKATALSEENRYASAADLKSDLIAYRDALGEGTILKV
ncbi:MAG TPA: serine/threonine-protein kinase [Planktothrix sp.]|jgi:serine/threonine-protein kinase